MSGSSSGLQTTDWKRFWAIPCIAMLLCLVLFAISLAVLDTPQAEAPLGKTQVSAERSSSTNLNLYLRFSLLYLFEFAIWGAWYVVLGNYLNAKGFSRTVIGRIYGAMPLGAIISPMFLGTVADKYFNTELILGVSHLVGAVLLLAMAKARSPRMFFGVALAYALVYSPTLSLVNSIVFAHIQDVFPEKEQPQELFGRIRVFGTIGWIVAGMSLKLLLTRDRSVNNRPILLAAALSAVLGLFCFALPETPPAAATETASVEDAEPSADAKEQDSANGDSASGSDEADSSSAIPFLRAIRLLKQPTFAVFYGVSLIVAMAMAFYFAFGALLLEQKWQVRSQNVGPIMTLGQWVEIFFLFTLDWFIKMMGMPIVLLVGVAAWMLRFAFFAWGNAFWLVLVGVALHGLCFDFFFASGFIHVQNTADPEITASAQSLYGVVVYGFGMLLGTHAAGWLNQRYTKREVPAE